MTYAEYEEYKATCLEVIAEAESVDRLTRNADFDKSIMDAYFDKEPKRLGMLMASGQLTPKGFDGAVEDLRSIGHLKMFLSDAIQKGNIARNELQGLEEAYTESVNAQAEA
jgi:hypothetical protein